MKKINRSIVAFIFAGMVGLTACEKDFLDVNTDPNNPSNASVQQVLPAAQVETAYVLGNQLQILGNFWAQHWTQAFGASQYRDLDKYLINAGSYDDRVFGELYAGSLSDFKNIADRANAEGNSNYAAIAEIMMAYTYQIVTDAWGDVPFSEALQGTRFLNPKYDPQEQIYDGLIPMIDNALAKIDPSKPTPGSDDLVFGGNMNQWRKFGNSLKLKIYLRQVYARPGVAQAGIQQMYAQGATFLGLTSSGTAENAQVNFVNNTLNRNPIYQTENQFLGGVNIIASNTVLNFMRDNFDPRLDDFFNTAQAGAGAGTFRGLNQGQAGLSAGTETAMNFSKPSDKVAGPTAPVVFISGAESLFLQAEAVARGFASGNAEQLYRNGIQASFVTMGNPADSVAPYVAQPDIAFPNSGTTEEKVEAIITQKWVSMTGRQGFEAWTEVRRTGYPSFIEPSLSSVITGYPARLIYPTSEATRNANAPALRPVTARVWWDVQ